MRKGDPGDRPIPASSGIKVVRAWGDDEIMFVVVEGLQVYENLVQDGVEARRALRETIEQHTGRSAMTITHESESWHRSRRGVEATFRVRLATFEVKN